MKLKGMAVGLPLLVVAFIALVLWGNMDNGTAPPVAVDLPCPAPASGCSARIGGHVVSLGLSGELAQLKPFQVWVKAPGAAEVRVSFTMPSMNMGFNRYTLRPDGAGVFRAQVILPTCVSGRRDWVMTLDIDATTRLVVPFAMGS